MTSMSDIDISRSGRVRKKSSLLTDYESPDSIEKPKPIRKIKPGTNFRRNFLDRDDASGRVTLKAGNTFTKKTKKSASKKVKYEPIEVEEEEFLHPDLDIVLNEEGEGDLEIDLPLEYDETDMPILAAEELIDEELLDEEDGATEITKLNSISRIKSQAESTYMMEKSRKSGPGNACSTNSPHSSGPRLKVKKKKGGPRATAYLLWSKEYRVQLAQKYPNMDFATQSKKLGELWAGLPDNQKKMWKARANKDSRKGENIKNSTPLPAPSRHVTSRKKTTVPTLTVAPGHAIYEQAEIPIRRGGGSLLNRKGNENNSLQSESVSLPTPALSKSRSRSKSGRSPASISPRPERISTSKRSPKNKNPSITSLQSDFNITSSGSTCSGSQYSSLKEDEIPIYKETSTTAMDVAAHFSVLGESLSIIGERLKEHEGPNISGSLSVMLDSFLCATGPLLCLTQQVPELNHIPPEKLSRMLDNIAYLMPGL